MSEGKKEWYVLRAISGKEAKVKELLDAEIKNTDLGRYVFQVLIPTEKTYVVRNGKRQPYSVDADGNPSNVLSRAGISGSAGVFLQCP